MNEPVEVVTSQTTDSKEQCSANPPLTTKENTRQVTAPVCRARQNIIFVSPFRRRVAQTFGLLAIGVAIFSLFMASKKDPDWKLAIALVWGLGPPIYFWFEYFVLFDNWKSPEAVAELKASQDLAAKIWAGVGAILALNYLK